MAHSSGAPAPASTASPSLDLASLPSIPLSADMVAHLLQNIQDGGSEHTGRVTRSKGRSSQSNNTSSAPPPPLPPWISSTCQAQVQDANIYATPTRADSKQAERESHEQHHHNEDNILKDAPAAADDDSQREAASGAARRTCAHCGREFKRASDCRRHERIHTNDKPHPCPFETCGKAFVQKSALTTHLRTHTGEKPYKCRVNGCRRLFADASSRKKHESTHNKGDKRHFCPLCPKQAFRRRDTMNLHMKRMHPHLLEFNDEPDVDQDQEMTSDVDEDATSDVEEDGTEATNGPSKDEQALLDFSSQPTDHSNSQTDLDNILTAYPHQMQFQTEQPISENTTSIEEEHTFRYDNPLARSQSAPASDHIPSSPNNSRSISVPLGDSIPESAASSVVADVASLLFDSSSSSGSQSATSSQTSYTTFINDTSKHNSNSNKSRYPFPYNAPPLHHRSMRRSNNSDGENESTSTVSRRNPAERKTTSSAEDLFDLLYAPTPIKTSSTMAYHHHNGYMTPMKSEFVRNVPKTAPPLHQYSQHHQHPITQQQRQPLMRVPSFGTPWAPGSPSKGQTQQLFRDVGDMFT